LQKNQWLTIHVLYNLNFPSKLHFVECERACMLVCWIYGWKFTFCEMKSHMKPWKLLTLLDTFVESILASRVSKFTHMLQQINWWWLVTLLVAQWNHNLKNDSSFHENVAQQMGSCLVVSFHFLLFPVPKMTKIYSSVYDTKRRRGCFGNGGPCAWGGSQVCGLSFQNSPTSSSSLPGHKEVVEFCFRVIAMIHLRGEERRGGTSTHLCSMKDEW
jgi:hypothetical protein